MMSLRAALAGLTLFTALGATVSGELPADAANRVDAVFEAWDSVRTPGCAVGVASHGLTVFSRAYGMADLEHDIPNRVQTIFEGGSVSKQFTAAAIALLALDGKLSLDDDVRKYIPEVPDYGAKVTVRHLLNHTSGLRDWGSVAGISGWGRQNRTHNHAHVLEIVSRQSALNYEPGDAYSYTNTGYNLMAIIVDRVSGMSFAEFSRKRLFEPLGMANTQWRDDYTRIVKGRSTAYSVRDGEVAIMRPIEHVHGNGGILTTVSDLLVWNESLTEARLGSEFNEIMHQQGRLNDGRQISYASGLRVAPLAGVPAITHTGSTSGYRAFLGRFPKQGLSVAMLCNASNVSTRATGTKIAQAFLGNPAEQAIEEHMKSPSPEELSKRVGLYRNTKTGMSVRLILDEHHLRIADTSLTPVGENRFQAGPGGPHLSFETSTADTRAGFRLLNNGDAGDAVFEPVDGAEPSAKELAGYEGNYESADADTTFTISVSDGALVLTRRPEFSVNLSSTYADAFEAPQLGTIRFHRNANGRVTELSLRQGRVYDMRFQRKIKGRR